LAHASSDNAELGSAAVCGRAGSLEATLSQRRCWRRPEQIGSKATARWTETTEKAATTPEQKKVLASGTGLLGFSSGYAAMMSCDTLLTLGTDFPHRQFYPEHARIAQIDIRPEALGNRCPIELGLVGDVTETLRALVPRLVEHTETDHLNEAVGHYRTPGCELKNPNFAAMAEAMGVKGIRAESPRDLRDALVDGFRHNGPALIDVVSARQELILPPKTTLAEAREFSLFMLKAVMASV